MAVPVSNASGQPPWQEAAFLAGSPCTLYAFSYFIWLSLESQNSVRRKFWRKVILRTGKLGNLSSISQPKKWVFVISESPPLPPFILFYFFCLEMGSDFPCKKAGNVGVVMQHCCCLVQVLSQQSGFCNCKHRYLMPSYSEVPCYFSVLWIHFSLNKVNAMFCQIRLIPFCTLGFSVCQCFTIQRAM